MLTQERLKELLDYNPETGEFKWRKRGRGITVGRIAGGSGAKGYMKICVDGKSYPLQHLAILYTEGYLPENPVGFINRVRTDQSRTNLREAPQRCHQRNSRMNKNNTSGVKGVFWDKWHGKWKAHVRVDGENKNLGWYYDLLEAAYARYAAEQFLGFTDCDENSSAKQYIDSMREAV